MADYGYNDPDQIRAVDYARNKPMPNPEPTQTSPYGFQNSTVDYSTSNDSESLFGRVIMRPKDQMPSPEAEQSGNPASDLLDRLHISNLMYSPNQLAQNNRNDINDMLGQQPETGFLQPKQTPAPTPAPTPPPVKKENTYYG